MATKKTAAKAKAPAKAKAAKATKGIPQRGKALKLYNALRKGWCSNAELNKLYWPKGDQACSWAVDCRRWAQASGLVACRRVTDRRVSLKLAKAGTADAKRFAMTS